MALKNWKIYIILISGIFLLSGDITRGCEDSYNDESGWFSLYLPNISGAESLMPFYYSTMSYYRTSELWANESYKKNTDAWYKYLNERVDKGSIDSILNRAEGIELSNTLDSALVNQSNDTSRFKHNRFIQYLKNNKKNEILNYLLYAKSIEHYLLQGDPWTTCRQPVFDKLYKMTTEGKRRFNTCTDSFLKMRYAYQCIKIYGNMPEKEYPLAAKECKNLYDSSFGNQPDVQELKYWALYFRTGSENKDTAKRNYLLSRVFDHTDEKEMNVLSAFNNNWLDESMDYAQNNHERAVMFSMSIIQYKGRALPELEKIYQLDPKNDKLGMLLSREINKLEWWLIMNPIHNIGEEYAKQHAKNKRSDFLYLKKVLAFARKVAQNYNTLEPGMWHVAAGYLSFMAGNNDEASQWYAKAEGEKNTENIDLQLHLSKILLAIARQGADEQAFEQSLYDGIKWMNEHKSNISYGYRKNLHLYLAKHFEEKHNLAKAALVLFKTNYCRYENSEFPDNGYFISEDDAYGYLMSFGSIKDFDTIINIINKNHKTPFEKYLTSQSFTIDQIDNWGPSLRQLNLSLILDHKGTWYMRHNMFKEALAVFKQIPDTLWQSEPYKTYIHGNPFYLDKWQPNLERHKADEIKFTKVTALERILKLQKDIQNKKGDMARKCFLLGNAYYNLSYFGKFWLMNAYHSSMYELSRKVEKNSINDNYYGCKLAKSYYLKAVEYAKDPKFKALCLIMAEQCETNHKQYVAAIKNEPRVNSIYYHPFARIFGAYYESKEYTYLQKCDNYVDYIAGFY